MQKQCGAAGAAARYANQLAAFYSKLVDNLADGRAALVINHGGVLNWVQWLACPMRIMLPGAHALDYCEGVRLFWEDGKFVDAEVLRVS